MENVFIVGVNYIFLFKYLSCTTIVIGGIVCRNVYNILIVIAARSFGGLLLPDRQGCVW